MYLRYTPRPAVAARRPAYQVVFCCHSCLVVFRGIVFPGGFLYVCQCVCMYEQEEEQAHILGKVPCLYRGIGGDILCLGLLCLWVAVDAFWLLMCILSLTLWLGWIYLIVLCPSETQMNLLCIYCYFIYPSVPVYRPISFMLFIYLLISTLHFTSMWCLFWPLLSPQGAFRKYNIKRNKSPCFSLHTVCVWLDSVHR